MILMSLIRKSVPLYSVCSKTYKTLIFCRCLVTRSTLYARHAAASSRKREKSHDDVAPRPPGNINENFYGVESDVGVIDAEKSTISHRKSHEDKKSNSVASQESFITTGFGYVRKDLENKPTFHGQFGDETARPKFIRQNEKLAKLNEMYKNSQKLGTINSTTNSLLSRRSSVREDLPESKSLLHDENSRVKVSFTNDKISEIPSVKDSSFVQSENNQTSRAEYSSFDEQYFPEHLSDDKNKEHLNSNIANENIEDVNSKYSNVKRFEISDALNDSTYLTHIQKDAKATKSVRKSQEMDSSATIPEERKIETNIFEQQYFGGANINQHDNEFDTKNCNDDDLSYIDDSYFKRNSSQHPLKSYSNIRSESPMKSLNDSIESNVKSSTSKNYSADIKSSNSSINRTDFNPSRQIFKYAMERDLEKFEQQSHTGKFVDPIKSNKLNETISKSSNSTLKTKSDDNPAPETAVEFVKNFRSMKIQKQPLDKLGDGNEKLDFKGFRILKNQVPNFYNYTHHEILEYLQKRVLYADDDVLVLDKPYNFVMHESQTTKDACLSQYLDQLAYNLDSKNKNPKLLTVHRLDKETSGCLLLARNDMAAQRLKALFAQHKIVKTYWIVTIRVPDPMEGVIDIPISEGHVGDKSRMVLHPVIPKDMNYKNFSKRGPTAVTRYKVISVSGNAALVEAKPETGIKHQIRVHFGFGLSCPILGDHKYSHLTKLVPQKLPSDMLERLHVRQAKARHIPMHIYARSILIPDYKDGRNLFVQAPLPHHFQKNLPKLKFKKN